MGIPPDSDSIKTALAAAGSAQQFRKARDFAAWLGLAPREYSTGGKTTLLGISKRGNKYLRRMIIHGARSCVTHLNRSRDRLGPWLDALQARMHKNKVTVALAAKEQIRLIPSRHLRRNSWRKLSNDAKFADKFCDIVGLYVDPPAHASTAW